MKLKELTGEIKRFERTIAPGGETELWGLYCEAMRKLTGMLPYDDRAGRDDPDVPEAESKWWLKAYQFIEDNPSFDMDAIKSAADAGS